MVESADGGLVVGSGRLRLFLRHPCAGSGDRLQLPTRDFSGGDCRPDVTCHNNTTEAVTIRIELHLPNHVLNVVPCTLAMESLIFSCEHHLGWDAPHILGVKDNVEKH